MKQDEHIIYENAIEAGNKILANTALISMYGQKRSLRSRLTKTVMPGEKSITVETGLDWKVNDTISLPSTSINWFELDTATIISYNIDTGVATLDRKLSYYHYGASASTGAQYNGVDIRGEVMLLTRNIKIKGNDTDAWGCQIVTSDFVEGNLEQRVGRTYMDHVEIYNCSQYDTWKAAIRFEGAVLGWSRISNSAIHHGLGIAGHIDLSENIEMVNNNVYTFSRYGIVIQTSKNITLDGNWVSGIHNRGLIVKSGGDTQGAIVACGHF
jgi:parallel beta-helix repeat protein